MTAMAKRRRISGKKPEDDSAMDIRVYTMSGRSMTCQVRPSEQIIAALLGMEELRTDRWSQPKLVFGTAILDVQRSFKDYNIQNGSELSVVFVPMDEPDIYYNGLFNRVLYILQM